MPWESLISRRHLKTHQTDDGSASSETKNEEVPEFKAQICLQFIIISLISWPLIISKFFFLTSLIPTVVLRPSFMLMAVQEKSVVLYTYELKEGHTEPEVKMNELKR